MTREEAKIFLCSIAADLGFTDIENYTCKDGEKMREAIKVLSQEPTYYPPCIDCNKKMDEIRRAYDNLKEQEPCEDWYDVPSDEMTLEQARQAVKDLRKKLAEHLEQEPCDNAISRQAAIDAFERFIHELGIEDEPYNYGEMALSVKNVPPITQKPIECDDAISREAALEKMADYVASGYADSAEDFEEYSRIICQLPSVTQKSGHFIDGVHAMGYREGYKDAQKQKSGKWIEHPEIETTTPEYLMFYECSECGDKPCFCKSDIHKKRFCSNCGAKMVEPQESEDKE